MWQNFKNRQFLAEATIIFAPTVAASMTGRKSLGPQPCTTGKNWLPQCQLKTPGQLSWGLAPIPLSRCGQCRPSPPGRPCGSPSCPESGRTPPVAPWCRCSCPARCRWPWRGGSGPRSQVASPSCGTPSARGSCNTTCHQPCTSGGPRRCSV